MKTRKTSALTLTALIFASQIWLLASDRATAADCLTEELPCQVPSPNGAFWWSYFDSVGDSLTFDDDDCGMGAPVDPQAADAGDTWVGFDVPSTPHEISYELFVKSDPLFKTMLGEIVILDMVRDDGGTLNPVLEVRLVTDTNALELIVYADDGPVVIQGGLIAPGGSRVTVELTKSLGPDTADGGARLRIDGQPWKVTPCFELWDNLPNGVRLGVVDVEVTSPVGTLEFQPLGFSHQFFGKSPK